MSKNFRLKKEDIKRIAHGYGACFATDRILVDGHPVGYMYRNYPDENCDSGWIFMAGDESQEYVDMPDNWGVYDVNTICNYDQTIVPYLDSEPRSVYRKNSITDEFVAQPPLTEDELTL